MSRGQRERQDQGVPPAAPHTPRSLIVTLYGAYGRAPGGAALAVAELIRLMEGLGVDAPSVRSSVSRLKRRGLLLAQRAPDGSAGYALSAEARQVLDDGDERIFTLPRRRLSDGWVLAVFSVPEAERSKRHLLRSRLGGLGFGTVAPGVWIAPGRVLDEATHTLRRLGLDGYVDLFRGEHLGYAATAEAVARWWDLDALAGLHAEFLRRHEPVLRSWQERPARPAADAYRDHLLALDAWRRLPYADPGLPVALLPARWPGERSSDVFLHLHELLRGPALSHVRQVRGELARRAARHRRPQPGRG
ncbi:PaaX family transcriptional regulator C-terminal domain-containing protein [Streptomyces sp. NRRL F-5126]|uniref:PaaX family transcriptional regulator n=1 Tax=Streptomyces sp. NRRL F-5126 TaxID=1463857 RepID=UPI00068B9EB1|nr:PaaX family transcriptional regulator C-terminal domain-containing protein [Streptomyces sp. NRRL F-5126]